MCESMLSNECMTLFTCFKCIPNIRNLMSLYSCKYQRRDEFIDIVQFKISFLNISNMEDCVDTNCNFREEIEYLFNKTRSGNSPFL